MVPAILHLRFPVLFTFLSIIYRRSISLGSMGVIVSIKMEIFKGKLCHFDFFLFYYYYTL